MVILTTISRNLSKNLIHVRRLSSIVINYERPYLNHKFTEEEQQKIIDVLNKSTIDDLKKYKISQNRIKSLEVWKNKKGPFQSLDDVLEVENVGVKVLEKLYENIVNNNKSCDVKKHLKSKRQQYITPPFVKEDYFKSVVGLYVGPSAISWARLGFEGNKLHNWDFYDHSSNRPKKPTPLDTFEVALDILNKLPVGDVYVMEATGNSALQNQGQSQNSFIHNNQQLELLSMLIALINSSSKHNTSLIQAENASFKNCIYFLKHKLPARLFNTLIGTEKVSTISTISNILSNTQQSSLPFTSVDVGDDLKNVYYSLSPVYKDLLGQSLMLTMTFIDICVYNNQNSLNAVSRKKK